MRNRGNNEGLHECYALVGTTKEVSMENKCSGGAVKHDLQVQALPRCIEQRAGSKSILYPGASERVE